MSKITIDRAVVEQALMYLGDEAPLCSGCVYEWAQAIKVLRAALEQPQVEQEPVAEITCMDEYGPMLGWHKHWVEFPVGTLIYIHPQPPRQPLTHQQREAMWHEAKLLARSTTLPFEWYCRGISDAEAAHGIKEQK